MGGIFRTATCTIVAAVGEDPAYGLPGLSRARVQQPHAKVGSITFVSSMLPYEKIISQTRWAERGWTYQEELLSRRTIAFTDHQVYWKCRSITCCEAIYGGKPEVVQDLTSHLPKTQQIGSLAKKKFDPMYRLIVPYTRRKLTCETDILNAVVALLSELQKVEPKIYHLWGVPIHPLALSRFSMAEGDFKPEAGLIEGLCWRLAKPGKRREGFPSWSWAGWKGELEMPNTNVRCCDSETRIWVELACGKSISWTTYFDEHLRQTSFNQVPRVLHIGGRVVVLQLEDDPSPISRRINFASSGLRIKDYAIANEDGEQNGPTPGGNGPIYYSVELCKVAPEGSDFRERLRSRPVDGIILGSLGEQSGLSCLPSVLLLDRHSDGSVERIGSAYCRVIQPSYRWEWIRFI